MSTFIRVLKDYCMIESMRDAKRFTSQQLNCSDVRKVRFLAECFTVLEGVEGVECRPIHMDEERIKDYIDSLRRSLYVGIGL